MRDAPLEAEDRRLVVTQLLPPGGTMTMTWTPERAGNWLFHCHVMHHVSPDRRLAGSPAGTPRGHLGGHGGHDGHGEAADRSMGMAGMEMELESYYDGVHGWSGAGRRVTPMIAPGGRFVVRFTPPRAGTFIYHTHLHDYRQLTSGLYGPLIVTGAGETFDPATDHAIVLGRSGLSSENPSILTDPDSVVINGQRAPRLVWRAGARHRVRLINITPDDIFSVSLQTSEEPVTWTPVAKDGAPLPPARSVAGPARQSIAVGETYEFEYQAPEGRRTAWLEVRTTSGKWQAQAHVVIR